LVSMAEKKNRPKKGKRKLQKQEPPPKADTIKERAVYVYLPNEGKAKEWKKRAKSGRTSVSKFVYEHVENSL